MARPVYSTLFVAEAVPVGSPVFVLRTDPNTVVVRDIEVNIAVGTGAQLDFQIAPGSVNVLTWSPLAPGYYQAQWTGRIVIGPGFEGYFFSTAGTWNVICSGYILTGP